MFLSLKDEMTMKIGTIAIATVFALSTSVAFANTHHTHHHKHHAKLNASPGMTTGMARSGPSG